MDDGYHNMDASYPNPFASEHKPNPRTSYGPDKNQARFKVIDGDFDQVGNQQPSQSHATRRDQIPSYHTLPNPETAHYVAPYQHAMKRTTNADRMKEIFGEHQDYSGMDDVDFRKPQRDEYGVNPMVMPGGQPHNSRFVQQQQQQESRNPEGYVPRMKYIEAEAPAREGYNQPTGNERRRKIYNAIIEYFPGFSMTKTASFGQFSVYKAVVQCLLCDGTRYVVAIVKNDSFAIGSKNPLAVLPWESFQTRWSDSDKEHKQFRLSTHAYAKPDRTILDDAIHLSRKTNTANLYDCDNLPLEVEIVRTKEDEEIAEFGTVSGALELFACILTFTEGN